MPHGTQDKDKCSPLFFVVVLAMPHDTQDKDKFSPLFSVVLAMSHGTQDKDKFSPLFSVVVLAMPHGTYIDANHYDFSVIVTNFGPKLRCYGQQSTCYGFPIIAGPKPFPI